MKKMASSNVLIVGMKGLGVEIGELIVWTEADEQPRTWPLQVSRA